MLPRELREPNCLCPAVIVRGRVRLEDIGNDLAAGALTEHQEVRIEGPIFAVVPVRYDKRPVLPRHVAQPRDSALLSERIVKHALLP